MENIEKKLQEEALTIAEQNKAVVIKNDADYQNASEMLKNIKIKAKEIESFFEGIKANAYASWKAICEKENDYKKPLVEAEKVLKGAIVNYQAVLEAERKQLEAKEQEKREKQIAKLEKAGKLEEAEILQSQAIEIVDNSTKASGISYQIDYEIVITDEAKVPVDLNGIVIRPVDIAVIKKLAKDSKGKVQIAGIQIKETKIAKVRV